MIIPVILCGGAGSRLWPVSRQAHPKPFMSMPDGESLLRKALRRALSVDGVEQVVTITNRALYFAVRDEYATVDTGTATLDYMLEPEGRNTAPAIAMAARRLEADGLGDAVMLVLAADHLIEKDAAFSAAVARGAQLARQGRLVTFGMKPTHPETGFGYIERGAALKEDQAEADVASFLVSRFVEKPDRETAQAYLDRGGFTWNSGVFCFTARDFLAALADCDPQLHAQSETCMQASNEKDQPFELDADGFAAMENKTRLNST